MITIDDFSKIEIRIATVLEATKVPDADRLIKLIFDFGPLENVILSSSASLTINSTKDLDSSPSAQNDKESSRNDEIERLPELVEKYPGRDVRQIMSAIAPFIEDPESLVGKQIAVCANLEPRTFRGYISQGMIMASGEDAETLSFLVPEKKVAPGSKIH